jgi:hypothetical protein
MNVFIPVGICKKLFADLLVRRKMVQAQNYNANDTQLTQTSCAVIFYHSDACVKRSCNLIDVYFL